MDNLENPNAVSRALALANMRGMRLRTQLLVNISLHQFTWENFRRELIPGSQEALEMPASNLNASFKMSHALPIPINYKISSYIRLMIQYAVNLSLF